MTTALDQLNKSPASSKKWTLAALTMLLVVLEFAALVLLITVRPDLDVWSASALMASGAGPVVTAASFYLVHINRQEIAVRQAAIDATVLGAKFEGS